MTQFLPPNLLALFAPREPLPYLPPVSKLPHEKKNNGYQGVGEFLGYFEDPKDTPPPVRGETREERLERRRRERAEQAAYKLEQEIAVWDPTSLSNVTTDPFKTLFVARMNYDTSECKLRREFEVHGPVNKIVIVENKANGNARGYAFIEYEHERDMHSAYKHADGKKIDGRRLLVDVERARTVKGWLPRRLGGGLGGTRRGGPDVNVKHSGREDNERERERYHLQRESEASGRGLDRDWDRVDRADRNHDRDRRRRSRERKRRSRSKSHDRKRRRSRDHISDTDVGEIPKEERSRRRRDGERDRERKRKRSRSNDRSDRDRERKRDRRDREHRDRKERNRVSQEVKEIQVKEEPVDDYPDYENGYPASMPYFEQVKYEDESENEEKYRIPEDRPEQTGYAYGSA